MRLRIKITVSLFLLAFSYSHGQMQQYSNKRELKGINKQWHKIVLPNDIFEKVSPDLSDIRVFGITASNDTIESPYLLRKLTDELSNKEADLKILNTSHSGKGYFFTFEIPSIETINQIKLKFKQQNFDWQLKLEGSQNQQEWFTIIDDYRILAIKNELTDFQFSKLSFPNSKYRFFRFLIVNSREKPDLKSISITQQTITEGVFRDYPIKKTLIQEDKETKQTIVDIELQSPVPVSYIKINAFNPFDYYRPLTIKYLSDSVQTEQGWTYNYRNLTMGTLNSFEKNEFKTNSLIIQKLKIVIHNQDNQSLTLDKIQIKGNVHELVTRFTEPATYFLTYGKSKAVKAYYDINRFTDKIPKTMTAIELGDEQRIEREEVSITDPLFKNKNWLWIIMTVIILLLGWFSVKMIRKK